MVEIRGNDYSVQICEDTGYTTAIIDNNGFNWILDKSDWGKVEGFSTYKGIHLTGNGVACTYTSDRGAILLTVSKRIIDGIYFEKYEFQNTGTVEFFMRDGDFGIHLPFQCNVKRKYNCLNFKEETEENNDIDKDAYIHSTVNAHLWCGQNITYIAAKKIDGDSKWLSVYLKQGNVVDYDIYRDVSRNQNGADYRGDIALLPKTCIIKPNETLCLEFEIGFESDDVELALSRHEGYIGLTADKYTAFVGENIVFSGFYNGKCSSVKVVGDGMALPIVTDGSHFSWTYSQNCCGEKTFYVTAGDKTTWIRVLFVLPINETLFRRAMYIAEKQQYKCEGSQLDGAYLIYDPKTETQYCDQTFHDHNSGRERIAMGLTVARAVKEVPNDTLVESLNKYRTYLERELVDTETGTVFNEIGRNNNFIRIYNYPWFCLFYFELFNISGDIQDLEIAIKILNKYYELGGDNQESQCIPFVRLIEATKKVNNPELEKNVTSLLIRHADKITLHGLSTNSAEMGYVMEQPVCAAYYLAQALLITGDDKYKEPMKLELKSAESFWIKAPDYHMNLISLRHWDGYWFGKYMQYGDLYPQDWSVLSGDMYHYIGMAEGTDKYKKLTEEIMRNNLCLYKEDGFATTGYLYPHKIFMYCSDLTKKNKFLPVGVAEGKRYDTWANDQDWAIYYASLYLM